MEENIGNLDVEYKRYLQILRPYVAQLKSEEAIEICSDWIQRLNNCCEEEKPVRNKYIFVLCYQLANGELSEPFVNGPPSNILTNISEITDSDISSEPENIFGEFEDIHKEFNQYLINQKECHSKTKGKYKESCITNKGVNNMNPINITGEKYAQASRRPETSIFRLDEIEHYSAETRGTEMYESRANNLILSIRYMKKQNKLLRNELEALKEESKDRNSSSNFEKVDSGTCTLESSSYLNTLKSQITALSNEKQSLLNTVEILQTQLNEFEDNKNRELEEITAKHKIELSKLKLALRDENKFIYENKIEELKEHYEKIILDMEKDKLTNDKMIKKDILTDIESLKLEKNKEMQVKEQEIYTKTKQLLEKDNIIYEQNEVITNLKAELEEQKNKLQSVLNNFLTTPTEKMHLENQVKIQELEKRLIRMEKSKAKCLKVYEAKLNGLQREKHLAECSLQLQLVKQRAQIVHEITEENQTDLVSALDKLETKYKDIVASVQSTAIRRTLQDEKALNAILEAACACGLRNINFKNQSQFGAKTATRPRKEESQSGDSDFLGKESQLHHTITEEIPEGGFCLEGDQLGKLFDQVYIPMRDTDFLKK